MFRVISCLAFEHDYRLVLLAAAICTATTFTSFSIYSRVGHAQQMMRLGWLFLTGVCTASGIWATHFVAVLAYNAGMQTAYDPILTAGSLLMAIVATTLGYFISSGQTESETAIGGAIVGSGIGLMHYTGMRALLVPGVITWDLGLVTASLLIGAGFASAATTAFHRLKDLRAIAAGAGLLTLGICGLHFTAMGAVTIVPDPTITVAGFSADASVLALAIAGLTVIVMLLGLAAAVIDRQTSQHSVERVRELVDAATEGIVIAADGIIVNVNRRITELSGRGSEQLIGRRIGGELLKEIVVAPRNGVRTVENTLNTRDGKGIPVEVVCQPFRTGLSGNEVYAIRDLTERRRNEAKINHMAHHDALTDLPNRVLFAERLKQALLRNEAALAVLCVDLDRFKEINDALGHSIGDALLQAVADRLRGCVGDRDTVARMGGDEFVIVQSADAIAVATTTLATRIIESLSAPFTLNGHQLVIGASVGIALAPADGTEPEQLIKSADIALYRAKSEGRGTYRFFEKDMDLRMQARRALEMDLRKALVNGEFELHYQPIHRVENNALSGFEALLRWKHPQRGMVPPSEIIPLAEETGFIIAIGEWVLRQACADAVKWPQHLKVAVNLSPKQFKRCNLVHVVANAIAAAGLNPNQLELEITETVLLADTAATIETLRKLHDFAVRIALDDFGTGYSSLSYLRSFPFDKIKIDQTFIKGLSDGSQEAVAIVRAMTQMGVSLGMSTTAEGVETTKQLEIVRAEGCQEVQGYLFSPPRPVGMIAEIIAEESRQKTAAASAA